MNYLYCRVSTKGQSKTGHSLEQQKIEMLTRYENAKVIEESYSGATMERPELQKLLAILKPNDIICVTKLDRLARNTVEGVKIIQKLFNMGVSVHVLNIGVLENTPMGKFFITTLLAVAEMERSTIIERTQSGKEIAKTKAGYAEGRPLAFTTAQMNHAMELLECHSYKEVEKMTKISKSTLVRERRRRTLETQKTS